MQRQWYNKGEKLKKEILECKLLDGEVVIWYLGQCGFAIKNRELLILIDPVLCDIVEDGESIRLYEPPFSLKDFKVDYILCTHNHVDHMNKETILGLMGENEEMKIVAPKECCLDMMNWGITTERILEARILPSASIS